NSFDENGGKTTTRSSHYSMAWKTKYEISKKPVCHFACGWLSGTLAAIYDAPIDTFDVEETNCSALENSNECSFNVRRRDINWTTFKSVGVGKLNNHHPQPIPENHVDYEGVFQAVTSMDISGNEKGEIPIFGVYLTRMYANYYNRISFEFLRQFCDKFDLEGREIATSLLVEAGHVCAFNTFGGIMISPEWDALIKPNLKTKEDWVHGITAVVNALGWGRWQVTKVCEKEAEFVLHDDYESVGYGAMYGKSEFPVSFLAEGAVAGVMDLIYLGEIQKKPEFTQKFYNKLFKGENSYKVESLSSQAMGDKITSFKVFKP
ncbi:MAG: hypothetical protein ACE5D6_00150, partial [Candidatus Zixiibacteriota bacterium]